MEKLKGLYKKSSEAERQKMFSYFKQKKQETMTDALTSAIAISSLFSSNGIDYDALTPKMEEAFELAFPNKDITDLEQIDSSELQGIVSNWKGKLFEVEVRDRLNNGELVGDITLEEGQYAELAESINQSGWDLHILNEDGTTAEFLQMKATNSISYINEAFEKYPDIDIISTSEIAELNKDLINSDISLEELQDSVVDVMDVGGEALDFLLPGLPFVVIALSEGKKVFVDNKNFDLAFSNAIERSVATGFSIGVGGVVSWVTGWGLLGIAASFFTRLFFSYDNEFEKGEELAKKAIPIIKAKNSELLLLKENYTV